MDNRCVVVCDSGAGGLSVLKILAKKYPEENFVYVSDGKNMPYGDKTRDKMLAVAEDIIRRALSFAPKLIVAACNTLSVALDETNADYGVKIIKTLPEIGKGRGYLFCTPFTAKSEYVKKLAAEVKIIPLKALAGEIEKAVRRGYKPTIDEESLKNLKKLDKNVDFISLGCTHYSLAASEFKTIFPKAEIIDGVKAAVEKSCRFLSQNPANRSFGEVCICDQRLKARSE